MSLYVMWNLENSLHNLDYVDLTLDSSDLFKSNEWQFHIMIMLLYINGSNFGSFRSFLLSKVLPRFFRKYKSAPTHQQHTDNHRFKVVSQNGRSLLKNSTVEFLRMRTTMFCCQITENRSHMREISDVFLLHKALQYRFSTAWDVW